MDQSGKKPRCTLDFYLKCDYRRLLAAVLNINLKAVGYETCIGRFKEKTTINRMQQLGQQAR